MWEDKNLSYAKRATLIKAVAQAIPTYVMNSFLLPKEFCKKIDNMTANFWWEESKIHWKNRKDHCTPEKEEGLRLRTFEDFKKGYACNKIWRMHTYPHSLVVKVLKAK